MPKSRHFAWPRYVSPTVLSGSYKMAEKGSSEDDADTVKALHAHLRAQVGAG